MKKYTAAALVCAMVLSMTACGNNAAPSDDGAKTYRIGIVQLAEHPALDNATNGFRDYLTEKLGDSVSFDVQNAQGEQTNCTTIVNQFVSSRVDLIMANATNAVKAAREATSDIPVVGTSVTDYVSRQPSPTYSGFTAVSFVTAPLMAFPNKSPIPLTPDVAST